MNRIHAYCPACEAEVELYTDGLSGSAHEFRCGNCFQGFHAEQVDRLEAAKKALDAHQAGRQKILDEALRG